MNSYQVLVVDDSALMRLEIRRLIERDPALHVAGMAAGGEEALRLIQTLNPDVITLDVEMKGMNGIETLHAIKEDGLIPVVMLASQTKYSKTASMRALEAGAVDFFLKDLVLYKGATQANIDEFLLRIRSAAGANLALSTGGRKTGTTVRTPGAVTLPPQPSLQGAPIQLVAIGSSTGGPSALHQVLSGLPDSLPVPVIIAQHMPPGFTRTLAQHLNESVTIPVQEATDGDPLQPGHVYICPSGAQTRVEQGQTGLVVRVDAEPTDDSLYKPSVNTLFSSATRLLGAQVLAVILTGMGSDGLTGCQDIQRAGGRIIAESPDTAVIYGMPRAVAEAGAADVVLPLQQIPRQVITYLEDSSFS